MKYNSTAKESPSFSLTPYTSKNRVTVLFYSQEHIKNVSPEQVHHQRHKFLLTFSDHKVELSTALH